jgi:DNA-binding NtrC family response regulator
MGSMKIVVIEDHRDSAEWLKVFLLHQHHDVHVLADGAEAERVVSGVQPDLVLIDLMLPDTDGLQLMSRLKQQSPSVAIVMMTGHATISRAVDAMQAGAVSFLEKPLDPARLLHVLAQVDERRQQARTTPVGPDEDTWQLGAMVTRDERVRQVMELIRAVAATDASILICGENGTGKELIADAVHAHSHRASGPFVKINCAAIPAELIESELFGYKRGAFTGAVSDRIGLFEMARRGTLLLDEIGEMPPHLQAKLLRVLQDRRARPLGSQRDVALDFRLVCATNCDLQEAIKQGKFREDLFFRINTISVKLPPLRERPQDVVLLANQFCAKYAESYGRPVSGVSPEAMHLLANHAWRGNVRELEHAIERAVIVAQGTMLLPEDLPDSLRARSDDGEVTFGTPRLQTLAAIEKWAIQQTLEHTRGNKRAAAAILGVYRPTLYNKLRKYGIGEIGDGGRRQGDTV